MKICWNFWVFKDSRTKKTKFSLLRYRCQRKSEKKPATTLDSGLKKPQIIKLQFPLNRINNKHIRAESTSRDDASVRCPKKVGCYKEIYRVLKPGQCFVVYEWCMTDAYNPNNEEQKRIKAEIELGNGLPEIRSTQQCLQAAKKTGFEVVWDKDLAEDSPVSWYLPLDTSHFSLSSFRLTAVGRLFIRNLVSALEYVGLAPKGSQRVQAF